jgi:hypothetical protein
MIKLVIFGELVIDAYKVKEVTIDKSFRSVGNKDVELFGVLLVGREIDDDSVPLQDLLEVGSGDVADQICALDVDVGCAGVWVLVVDSTHALESVS